MWGAQGQSNWQQQQLQQQQNWSQAAASPNAWQQGGDSAWQQLSQGSQASQAGQQAASANAWQQQQSQGAWDGLATGGGSNGAWGAAQQASNSWGQSTPSGPPKQLDVQGCQHGTIGGIVRGSFTIVTENHGKPVYQKDEKVSGLDVMIYFWDERDGPSQSGWWFGPKVGGEQVWAYSPDKAAASPPRDGWQVPFGSPVDTTFIVDPRDSNSQSAQNQQSGGWEQQSQLPQQSQQAQQAWSNQQAWINQQAQQAMQQSWDGQQAQQAHQQQSWGMQQAQQLANPWVNQWSSPQNKRNMQDAAWNQQQGELAKRKAEAEKQRQATAEAFRQQKELQMQEMKKRQDELKKKHQEELMRKNEEQQRKMVEWKIKMEEDRQKKLEEDIRKKEELRLKREAEEVRRLEQRAAFAIRRVIQRIRVATPDNFESLEHELNLEVAKELENCGSQAEAVKGEIESGLEQARKRVVEMTEARRKEEARKAEEERKRKEKADSCRELARELAELVVAAEEQVAKLKETNDASDFNNQELSPLEIENICRTADLAEETCSSSVRGVVEFFRERTHEMKAPEAEAETKAEFPKLLQRIQDMQRSFEATKATVKSAKDRAAKRAASILRTQDIEADFKKFDKDRDGVLSKSEVAAYAKSEFNVKLAQEHLEYTWMSMVEPDTDGVSIATFPRLRSIVGIQRELARNKIRVAERIEKEKVIGGLKDALRTKVKAVFKTCKESEKAVRLAEDKVAAIAKKAKVMAPEEIFSRADQCDEACGVARREAQQPSEKLKAAIATIEPKYAKDLHEHIADDKKLIGILVSKLDARITRVERMARRFRERARKKELDEIEAIRNKAAKVLQYNQSVKQLSNEDFTSLFDNGNGIVGESDVLSWWDTADKEIRELRMEAEVEEKKEDENNAENVNHQGEAEEKNNGEAEEAKAEHEAAAEPEEEARLLETIDLSAEQISRLFTYLEEEGTGFFMKEDFLKSFKKQMTVVRETALTSEMHVSVGKTVRRLSPAEFVEVIRGPFLDTKAKVKRVFCKALKDGLEGWATTVGNTGTLFLKDGGGVYKVLRTTFLTDSFDSTKEDKSDESKRLRAGVLLEVREAPRKEQSSGLTRMRARVRSKDPRAGWVTTADKQGKPLVRPV